MIKISGATKEELSALVSAGRAVPAFILPFLSTAFIEEIVVIAGAHDNRAFYLQLLEFTRPKPAQSHESTRTQSASPRGKKKSVAHTRIVSQPVTDLEAIRRFCDRLAASGKKRKRGGRIVVLSSGAPSAQHDKAHDFGPDWTPGPLSRNA